MVSISLTDLPYRIIKTLQDPFVTPATQASSGSDLVPGLGGSG